MVFLYLRQQDNGEESSITPGATRDDEVVPGKRSFPHVRYPITTMDTMAYNGSQVNIAEIGRN